MKTMAITMLGLIGSMVIWVGIYILFTALWKGLQ